jgi:glycosyltransferase involved in cell wall biosynthesis
MRPLTIFVSHGSELFTDDRPHGDGLMAYEFVSRLAERGHRLHVAVEQVDLQKPLHPNIVLHPIPTWTTNPLFWRVEFALRSRCLLRRLMRTEKFDLIHQLNPVTVGLSLGLTGMRLPIVLGVYAGRWLNDPDAITSRYASLRLVLSRLRGLLSAMQQNRAAAILLSTPAAEDQLEDKQMVGSRTHLLPFGTDTHLYCPADGWDDAARFTAEQAHPTILYLASLTQRKGIFEMLKAFQIVAREFPTCRLRIVGGGEESEEVKQLALASPAAEQIEFLPNQPRAATIDLYRACTIFCAPSLGAPFGGAEVEAMACGSPIVASAVGGHLFTVSPQGGVLTPMEDSETLAAALLRLLHDPGERLRMAQFNRRWAEEQFSWDIVIPRLEQIYAQVCGSPAA